MEQSRLFLSDYLLFPGVTGLINSKTKMNKEIDLYWQLLRRRHERGQRHFSLPNSFTKSTKSTKEIISFKTAKRRCKKMAENQSVPCFITTSYLSMVVTRVRRERSAWALHLVQHPQTLPVDTQHLYV